MPDPNKTIKGLECCLRMISNDITCAELKCPYYSKQDQARLICWTDMNRDALSLIRNAYNKEKDQNGCI